MNRYLLVFMGLLALEIALCTMQKYLFLSNLGTATSVPFETRTEVILSFS